MRQGIPAPTEELWWHAFTNFGTCCGVTMTVICGSSTIHPEQIPYRFSKLGIPSGIECKFGCGLMTDLRYVRSWNHEPSDEEKELVGL